MNKSKRFEDSEMSPLFSRIGRRIIIIMVLLSSVVTLTATLLQLSWDYNREYSGVERRHHEVETIHMPLLASSLWNFDLVMLQQRLDGLVNLPRVNYLEINTLHEKFTSGKKLEDYAISHEYPIYYSVEGVDPEFLGTLYVESDAQAIYNYLLQQFLTTLIINGIKTAIVCYLILLVVHASINQRIFSVAQYLRNYNPRHPSEPLVLPHKRWIMDKEDEIVWLGDETNRITSRLTTFYKNIRYEQGRFSDFANVSSDWLWELDHTGALVYASDEMQSGIGVNTLNRPVFAEIPLFKHAEKLLNKLHSRQSFNFCQEQLIINGDTRYLLFQAIANYENEQFLGFRGTAIDITVLKQALVDLENLNNSLELKVAERTEDLKASVQRLKDTQSQLIESEKLAALGGLVAGVAHEVNTPLGISVTAASVINDIKDELNRAFAEQTLTSTQFSELMQRMDDSTIMLESNLNRAAGLIRDFKQTAVDQVSESRSEFTIHQVLQALIASVHPETRKVPVEPRLYGDKTLTMNSLPGVLTQVISNLILNSVNHAFTQQSEPSIEIQFKKEDDNIIFEYLDNGSGVDKSLHQKIFEPFFTSKRGKGGSGLGLNLVFNLIHQKLKGSLQFESEINKGVHFTFTVPEKLPMTIEENTTLSEGSEGEKAG
ncbi:ATP-binding protein [Vibrio sp. HA2012]|uniref:PAS domain-containing sensor histidine kinase n=1 Tax=Vibrio sp. HA2012 TaxID=1971595 RepID=UPI000C2BB3C0|nr:ATP-binding protein [Vibrio sp. HA2012]PJC88208.1 ATP-binding protein [Vibrio sp. HA2012]